jgi:hypothetical protein
VPSLALLHAFSRTHDTDALVINRFIASLDPSTITGQRLVLEAHKRNLEVHTWTFRNKYEDARLVKYFKGSAYDEHLYFFELGVDAVFTESPTDAVLARQELWRRQDDSISKDHVTQQHQQQAYVYYAILFIVGIAVGRVAGGRSGQSDKKHV